MSSLQDLNSLGLEGMPSVVEAPSANSWTARNSKNRIFLDQPPKAHIILDNAVAA